MYMPDSLIIYTCSCIVTYEFGYCTVGQTFCGFQLWTGHLCAGLTSLFTEIWMVANVERAMLIVQVHVKMFRVELLTSPYYAMWIFCSRIEYQNYDLGWFFSRATSG